MPIFKACFCVLLLAILFSTTLVAQHFQAESIRIKAGLPTDNVWQAAKTKDGFVYFATRRGLCKYDGYHFYTNESITTNVQTIAVGNKGTIYYNEISVGLCSIQDIALPPVIISPAQYQDADPNNDHYDNLYIDKKERIWCSDFAQVKYFTANHTDSGTYVIDKNNQDIQNVSFVEQENGLFVVSKNGIFYWEEKEKKILPVKNAALDSTKFSAGLALDSSRILLAATNGDFIIYNTARNEITDRQNIGLNKSDEVKSLCYFNEYAVYYAANSALYSYNFNTHQKEMLYSTSGPAIISASYDKAIQTFWINTNRGVVRLQPKEAFIKLVNLPEKDSGRGQIVKNIVQDNDGELWVNLGNALLKYSTKNGWRDVPLPSQDINCNGLYEKDNNMYITTNNGLYSIQKNIFSKIELSGDIYDINKIIIGKNNKAWLLFNNNQVKIYDLTQLKQDSQQPGNEDAFWTKNKWNDILCDNIGNIWLAGWVPPGFGVARYDTNSKKFIEASSFPANADHNKFIGDYYNRISNGRNKTILFSGYGGFNVLDSNGTIIHNISTKVYSIASEQVEGISQTRDSKIWFATAEGLYAWDSYSDKISRISQTDGLPIDELINGYCQLPGNQLVLGYENGLIFVDQNKVLKPHFTELLVLSSIEVNGKIMPTITTKIELKYNENNIKLYCSALSFSDKDKLAYRYKTDDETTWTYIKDVPEISLAHIAPGNYNITVEVGDNIGNWQIKQLHINIIIHPPFYQTYWFRFLVTISTILLILLAYQYLLGQQKTKENLSRKLKEAQMQALRTQMNPHFIFNSLNSINSFILDKKTDEASDYLTTFSRLMRTTLELTRKDTVRLSQEMEALRLYLEIESTRLEQGFDYNIQVAENVDTEGILIPPLILQPFVENAIWHGLRNKQTHGNIDVLVDMKTDNMLHVKIEDDGIGRTKSASLKKNFKEHKSYGMEITFNRLQLHHPNNKLVIDDIEKDGIAGGTAVHLYIHV